jgi:hypothetical protein
MSARRLRAADRPKMRHTFSPSPSASPPMDRPLHFATRRRPPAAIEAADHLGLAPFRTQPVAGVLGRAGANGAGNNTPSRTGHAPRDERSGHAPGARLALPSHGATLLFRDSGNVAATGRIVARRVDERPAAALGRPALNPLARHRSASWAALVALVLRHVVRIDEHAVGVADACLGLDGLPARLGVPMQSGRTGSSSLEHDIAGAVRDRTGAGLGPVHRRNTENTRHTGYEGADEHLLPAYHSMMVGPPPGGCQPQGVVMREQDLREGTRKAAKKSVPKLKKRRSKGEKAGRKRMAQVAAVYTVEPLPFALLLSMHVAPNDAANGTPCHPQERCDRGPVGPLRVIGDVHLHRPCEPTRRLCPRNVLHDDAAALAANPPNAASQVDHDAGDVEMPPAALSAVVAGSNWTLAVTAPRDSPRGRHVDDEAVSIELEADDAGMLEGKQNSEYTGGAHGVPGGSRWCRNLENTSPARAHFFTTRNLLLPPATPHFACHLVDHAPIKRSGEPDFEQGFLLVECRRCGDSLRVPFACKSRGICPSCMGRRMCETAVSVHTLKRRSRQFSRSKRRDVRRGRGRGRGRERGRTWS